MPLISSALPWLPLVIHYLQAAHTQWLKPAVMHGMCEWVVQQGLRLLEKYLAMEAHNSVSSVDMVITLLLHGMVDVAISMLPPEILSAKIHAALEDISRRMLGSMVQLARKHHLDMNRAASFNDAWTKLQAMKRSLVAKAKKEKKGLDNSAQKVCKYHAYPRGGRLNLNVCGSRLGCEIRTMQSWVLRHWFACSTLKQHWLQA